MNLNILQWNARSITSNKGDLELFMHDNNIHVALISETWLKKDKFFSISGYNILRSDRNDGFGGVAILIKTHFLYTDLGCVTALPEVECRGISVVLQNGLKYMYILYKRPQVSITAASWNALFRQLKKPFLIGGDFNVHHTSWGSSFSNREGTALLDSLEEDNLVVLNDGNPTRLTPPNSLKSAVDLTLCSPSLAPLFTSKVSNESLGSDHFVILINLRTPGRLTQQPPIPKLNIQKWDLKNADWKLFQDRMENLTTQATSSQDTSYDTFIKNVNTAAEAAVPKVKPHNKVSTLVV